MTTAGGLVASASAPGKVLVCGGYLVVESPNVGLSVGINARFTTNVTEYVTNDTEQKTCVISVESPQFNANFRFEAVVQDGSVQVRQIEGRDSPFLFYGVLTALAYLHGLAAAHGSALQPFAARLVLLADNDFYSQRNYLEQIGLPVTTSNLRYKVPPCNPLVGAVSKTGLGSSAALTTSFVAALCAAIASKNPTLTVKEALETERLHRVAQVAHSVAQGKIGSGFDVYTAVYGTNVYQRFPPARVDGLMSATPPTSFNIATVQKTLDPSVEWVPRRNGPANGEQRLPPGVHLVLADIHQGGSATPGMVSKIMAWRKSLTEAEGADNLWSRQAAANEKYLSVLGQLSAAQTADPATYDAVVKKLAAVPAREWAATSSGEEGRSADVIGLFLEMAAAAALCRGQLREMGEKAGVEVEPTTLTPLLDATEALPGVVTAGCPGAGGYDAVFGLVLAANGDADAATGALEQFWEAFPGLQVCPLLVREDSNGGLSLQTSA